MQYKKFRDTDISLSRLGMGNMRFPTTNGKFSGPIDREPAKAMLEYAMAHGVNYYDSAYVYHDGESEAFLGEVMKQWPRDSFYLATKYYCLAGNGPKAVFAEQLERLQTDYIDFYLIHSVCDENIDEYVNGGAVAYFKEQKAAGRVKKLGFSYHGSVEGLGRMIEANDDWDFVQIQLNYFDWKFGNAKDQYELLAGKGIPVMVMEPVRGGKLATLTPDCEKLLKSVHPDWSTASWGFRWVKRLPGVQVILSGMTVIDQMMDNVKTFEDDRALTDEEEAVLFQACDMFKEQMTAPCTACKYCMPNCPMSIEIPTIMDLYNTYKLSPDNALLFMEVSSEASRFSECVGCRSCEQHCPQHIHIATVMAEMKESMLAKH